MQQLITSSCSRQSEIGGDDISPWRLAIVTDPSDSGGDQSLPSSASGCASAASMCGVVVAVHVRPYAFTYVTKVKQRWVNLSLAAGFAQEFERFNKNPRLLREVVRRGLLRIIPGDMLKKRNKQNGGEPVPMRFCETMDDVTYPPLRDDATVDLLLHRQLLRPGDVILHVLHKHETPMLLHLTPHPSATQQRVDDRSRSEQTGPTAAECGAVAVAGAAPSQCPFGSPPIKILRFCTFSESAADGDRCGGGSGGGAFTKNNVLVVSKPSGMPSLPCGRNVFNALTTILEHGLPHAAAPPQQGPTNSGAHCAPDAVPYTALIGWAAGTAVDEQVALSEWLLQNRCATQSKEEAVTSSPCAAAQATLRAHPLHRLDTGTSGVLALQLNAISSITDSAAAADRETPSTSSSSLSFQLCNKTYIALVQGQFDVRAGMQGLSRAARCDEVAECTDEKVNAEKGPERGYFDRGGEPPAAQATHDNASDANGGRCGTSSCRGRSAPPGRRHHRHLWWTCDWPMRCNGVGRFYAIPPVGGAVPSPIVVEPQPTTMKNSNGTKDERKASTAAGGSGIPGSTSLVPVPPSFRVASWASSTHGQKTATTLFRMHHSCADDHDGDGDDVCPTAMSSTAPLDPSVASTTTSLISCVPVTGRTHQIRVHCAAIGCPIVGDVKYTPHNAPPATAWGGTDRQDAKHASSEVVSHPAAPTATPTAAGTTDGDATVADVASMNCYDLCNECAIARSAATDPKPPPSHNQRGHRGSIADDDGHPLEQFCLHAISCEVVVTRGAGGSGSDSTKKSDADNNFSGGEITSTASVVVGVVCARADTVETGLPYWGWRRNVS